MKHEEEQVVIRTSASERDSLVVDRSLTEEGPFISGAKKQHLDKYTLAARRATEDPSASTPVHLKLITGFEHLNRRVWYKLFHKLFDNPQTFERIPISKLESLFVIPSGDAIGDMVVTIPIFQAIKRRNPNCRIGTMISHRNEALLRCESSLDDRYLFRDRLDFKHYPEVFRARRQNYQAVLNLHLNKMTEFGLISNIISPSALKVASTHKRKDLYSALFNIMGPYRRNTLHFSQLGLQLLNLIIEFDTPIAQWETRPALTICEDTRARTNARIDAALDSIGAKWFVYVNTQARIPFREWGVENTAEFSKLFAERYPDGAILFTSSPVRHHELESQIHSGQFQRSIFFQTTYDLLELAVLADRSRLVITPDTSITHFASAMNKPTIVFWPDRNYLPVEWMPLQVPSANFVPHVHGDPVSTVPVRDVWNAACALIEGTQTETMTSFVATRKNAALYQASSASRPLHALIHETLELQDDGGYELPEWLLHPSDPAINAEG